MTVLDYLLSMTLVLGPEILKFAPVFEHSVPVWSGEDSILMTEFDVSCLADPLEFLNVQGDIRVLVLCFDSVHGQICTARSDVCCNRAPLIA
jgi:hypothetical protein